MTFMDTLQSTVSRVLPEKKNSIPLQASGGIGSGHVPFEDDMIVSKPTIVFHASQIFFNFLAMCCFASAAAFQAKWHVGPSGLSGFAIFISVAGARLARALKEVRVSFILSTTGVAVSLLISFIVTISAFTEPGCKNADNDPHASLGDDFKKGLDGFCNTKKAAAVFFWLAFVFWVATFVLAVIDWRNGKSTRAHDPPFQPPEQVSDHVSVSQEDEESLYQAPLRKPTYDEPESASPFSDENRYSGVPSVSSTPYSYNTSQAPVLPRPSIDAYGAFSDPPPSGFGGSNTPPAAANPYSRPLSPPDEGPRVSRTMQYADPYAAVRATVASGQTQNNNQPPSYGAYGYI
ncbi:hypothetical protein ABKN59_008937 [Abortiporus biennis]